jgi:uncharacterized heparinase superfamily protein
MARVAASGTGPARRAPDWRAALTELYFANPLYRFTLAGRAPERLERLPPEAWPGDLARGGAILSGTFVCAGHTLHGERPDWFAADLDEAALAELHGFAWLDDLAATDGEAARRRARDLIADWLDHADRWHRIAWSPAVLGRRIAAWLAHARFVARGDADGLGPRILASLARQLGHLVRILGRGPQGAERFLPIRALIYGILCGVADGRHLHEALQALDAELDIQMLQDGGHIERSPAALASLLAVLIDIRDMLTAAGRAPGVILEDAIAGLTPVLQMLRHGDGGLALFNGAGEGSPARFDAIVQRAGLPPHTPRPNAAMGFQRIDAGSTSVIMDAGAPPPPGFDRSAHAGALSFEMSHARERIIVNCGAHPVADAGWRLAQRASAAHSTAIVDDTNSVEIDAAGGLGARPLHAECTREAADGNVWLTAGHDGYLGRFGLTHRRRLYLTASGEDFRGEDSFFGDHRGHIAIRFHLHPEMQVSLIQSGGAALLRARSGAAWRLRASGAAIELAESIYLGRRGEARRSEQIVLTAPLAGDTASIKWALRRVDRD